MRPYHTAYLRLGIPSLNSIDKRQAKAEIADLIQVEYDYLHSSGRLTSSVLYCIGVLANANTSRQPCQL